MSIRGCPHVDAKAHSSVCSKYKTNGFHDPILGDVFFADVFEAYEAAKTEQPVELGDIRTALECAERLADIKGDDTQYRLITNGLIALTSLEKSSPARESSAHRLVIIESPYAGDIESNVEYARKCVRDSLLRGEAPIASHLLYTQRGILRDEIPEERQHGIDAGLAWRKVASASVVYTDMGISKGMEYGIKAAEAEGISVEYRSIV